MSAPQTSNERHWAITLAACLAAVIVVLAMGAHKAGRLLGVI